MRRYGSIAPLLALCGCSLTIADLAPPTCDDSAQCSVLNELEGIAQDACELYQCSAQRFCEFGVRDMDADGRIAPMCAGSPLALGRPVDCDDTIAGGTERCNGRDDDCDGVIDETFVADEVAQNALPPIASPPATLASIGPVEEGRVGYSGEAGALAIVHASRAATSLAITTGAATVGPVPLRFRRNESLMVFNEALLDDCWTESASGTVLALDNCEMNDVDVALTPQRAFVATVSDSGCREGQVRIGMMERADAANGEVIVRGPGRRSPIFTGVDVDPAQTGGRACTGASRASGMLGAARPSIAALEGPEWRDQALAAWIADSIERPECGGTEADVEILALHVQQDDLTRSYRWVTASNEGRPQVIGRTVQGGRPAIAAWSSTGYVVGFASAGSGIALRFVPMQASPPAFTRLTGGDPNDRTGVETAALTPVELGTIPTTGIAEDVTLAIGAALEGGVELGVAWREGCGSSAQTVHFRQLFLRRGATEVSLDPTRAFEPIVLTPQSAPSAGPPAIAYALDGMLAQGVARTDGRPTGTRQNDGGWFVAWEDGSNPNPGPGNDQRILARRVSEADGRLLNPSELLVLGPQDDRRRTRPMLYATGTGTSPIRFAYLELGGPQGASFYEGPLTCMPE